MQTRALPAPINRPTRGWLPDAGLDAHPLGTWLLELGFDLWIRAFYRRTLLFPDGFHIAPGTLIASNHRRDVDGPMLGTILVQRRGLHFQWPLPFYATREDLFRPGILARLTVRWPRPIRLLLGRISLAWFFPLGRAEPMRRVREFTLGETLRALADAVGTGHDCTPLLNARGRRELPAAPGTPLRQVLETAPRAALERWWGLRRLALPALRALKAPFRATVDAQLAHFAKRLDEGRCVYFAPEGTISMDGRFGRVRAGFFRITRLAAAPPWVQPMALSYDALGPGRARVVVRIGEPFRADPALDRRAFDATLRRAVLALAPVTPSHLLARFLLHGPGAFTQDELADWVARSRAALRNAQASLDPLLARAHPRALVGRRVRWLERKGIITRTGARFRVGDVRDAPPGWQAPANVMRYLDNALADLLPDPGRILPC